MPRIHAGPLTILYRCIIHNFALVTSTFVPSKHLVSINYVASYICWVITYIHDYNNSSFINISGAYHHVPFYSSQTITRLHNEQ